MLKELRISNFRSFKDEILFTMEPDLEAVSEHEDFLHVLNDKSKLLKIASMYGPNAGGKTNFLNTFYFIKFILVDHHFEEETGNSTIDIFSCHRFFKFNFIEKNAEPIRFAIYFVDDAYEMGIEVEIDLTVDSNDKRHYIIKNEAFSYRILATDQRIDLYSRSNNKVTSKSLQDIFPNIPDISDEKIYLYFLYDNFVNKTLQNNDILDVIGRFYIQMLSIEYLNSYNLTLFNKNDFTEYYSNNIYNKAVCQVLNRLDINISKISYDQNDLLILEHEIANKKYKLKFKDESEGTKELLYLLPNILSHLAKSSILVIDEFDAHLHPALTKKIIELFHSNINNKSQMIFNSHDIMNMNNDNFRRDEIWFLFRNEKLESQLVCLSDYVDYKGEKVRKDAKYSKQYMEGRYGADPFIRQGLILTKGQVEDGNTRKR